MKNAERISSAKEHLVWIDILRILAIFSVIVQHSATYYFEGGYGNSLAIHALNNLSRFHVPSFVMITGVLLLGRDMPPKKIWTKYIKRIAIAFCFWSFLYTTYNFAYRWGQVEIIELIKGAIGDFCYGGTRVLWYIVMLFGLYAITPMLSTWVKNAGRQEQIYAVGILLALSSVLPTLTMVHPLNLLLDTNLERLQMVIPGVLVFFYLAGFIFVKNENLLSKRATQVLAIIVVAVSAAIICGYSIVTQETLDLNCLPIVGLSLGVFVLVRYRGNHYCDTFKIVIRNAADCTFGIFLVHRLIQYLLQLSGAESVLLSLYPVVGVMLYSVVVFFASWILVALLRLNRFGRIIT